MDSEILLADKPAGWLTHTDGQQPGFVDFLEKKTQQNLKVVHRLDRGTTGAMVFAKTKDSAAKISAEFTENTVKKQYLFITDRPVYFQ